ncbi:MAG: hypothetical protein IJQ39_14545 [Thermoguttaceae bacterium]|nr:hypothetical protein [Thermoguttaceae bacterium]
MFTVNPNAVHLHHSDVKRVTQSVLTIPPGRLAYSQWYENDPELLEREVAAMQSSYPQFQLQKLPDGKLSWIGDIRPGLIGNNGWTWRLEAVYENNHPYAQMGSSVLVYLREPDMNLLIRLTGWRPRILLSDSQGFYFSPPRIENVHNYEPRYTLCAAMVLRWTIAMAGAYELVLAGEMTQEEFDCTNENESS